MKTPLTLAAAAACLALGACSSDPKAPTDAGICWHVSPQDDETLKFNKVAEKVPDMEHCAVELERMRLQFLRLGSMNREMAGAYQGNYLFLREEGIYRAQRYKGGQYLAMVRYNGKLVMPGAVPQ